jgi:hypothetical protein
LCDRKGAINVQYAGHTNYTSVPAIEADINFGGILFRQMWVTCAAGPGVALVGMNVLRCGILNVFEERMHFSVHGERVVNGVYTGLRPHDGPVQPDLPIAPAPMPPPPALEPFVILQ